MRESGWKGSCRKFVMPNVIWRKTLWAGCAAVMMCGMTDANAFQLANRPAEEWIPRLERSEQVQRIKVDEVVARLDLKPGDVVADIGAGAGVFSLPLARAVAPGGKLLAVELQQGFLDHIELRAKEEKVANVQPVLGEFNDPKLPSQIDVAFFHDVLHHIENRETYLKNLAAYLKPAGRIVMIELNNPHADVPEMHILRDQVEGWLAAAGLHPVKEFDLFDDKYFVVFAKK